VAKIGNKIVKVANHPEDYMPSMLEKFKAMALQQHKETGTKPKKQAEQRETSHKNATQRRSSRNKKPTEFYQAGLNSMQASSAPRGYVDSSGRYRSSSRERLPRDQGSGQRPPSQQCRYSRQPSRDSSAWVSD
jgi:hypothetical protein